MRRAYQRVPIHTHTKASIPSHRACDLSHQWLQTPGQRVCLLELLAHKLFDAEGIPEGAHTHPHKSKHTLPQGLWSKPPMATDTWTEGSTLGSWSYSLTSFMTWPSCEYCGPESESSIQMNENCLSLQLHCNISACEATLAATLPAFHAEYYLWCSDWLKLLRWPAAQNPLLKGMGTGWVGMGWTDCEGRTVHLPNSL